MKKENKTIYKCKWSEIPKYLKTKNGLKKLGFKPTGIVVAYKGIKNRNISLYNIFDIQAIKVRSKRNSRFRSNRRIKKMFRNRFPLFNSENRPITYLTDKELSAFKRKYKKLNSEIVGYLKVENNIVPLYNCIRRRRNEFNYIEKDIKTYKNDYIIGSIKEVRIKGKNSLRIRQLALIDMNGNCLFNEYFKILKDEQYPTWAEKFNIFSDIIKNKIIVFYNTKNAEDIIRLECENSNINTNFHMEMMCLKDYLLSKYNVYNIKEIFEINNIKFNKNLNEIAKCFIYLSLLDKNNALQEKRRIALDSFNSICYYKEKKGDKKATIKGKKWLEDTFDIRNMNVDFRCFDIKLCNNIIQTLKPYMSIAKSI